MSELAERSGVSKSYLWNLENKAEHQKPSAETVYSLAEALGTTMSQLIGRRLLNEPEGSVDEALSEFAKQANLSDDEVAVLASIQWRGDKPRTAKRWGFVYDSLKASRSFDQ